MSASVILDCDFGLGIPGANVDDALALVLALADPKVMDLLAITTVFGNVDAEVAAAAVRRFLNVGTWNTPVLVGASRPLFEDPVPWRRHMRRDSDSSEVARIWPDTEAPNPEPRTPVGDSGAVRLAELVAERPGEVTIVATGPLTNIATAMFLDENFSKNVREIIAMAGVFDVPGYRADTNVAIDPEAARRVVTSGAAVRLIPLDVTTTTSLTASDVRSWPTGGGDSMAHRVSEATLKWIEYSAPRRGLAGCWVHDALTVAGLVDPALLEWSDYYVEIDDSAGPLRGHAMRWGAPGAPGQAPEERKICQRIPVATAVDNERLLHLLKVALARLS